MTQAVEWSQVEAQCARWGWGLGWAVGIAIAAIGVAVGADVYLTALRTLVALMGFVLLGWTTGIFLSRFASTETDEEPNGGPGDFGGAPPTGSNIDLTVGDTDPGSPGPGSSGSTRPPDLTPSAPGGELARRSNAA